MFLQIKKFSCIKSIHNIILMTRCIYYTIKILYHIKMITQSLYICPKHLYIALNNQCCLPILLTCHAVIVTIQRFCLKKWNIWAYEPHAFFSFPSLIYEWNSDFALLLPGSIEFINIQQDLLPSIITYFHPKISR